jgi:uncharacterized protein (TIGR03437 family)
MSRTKKILFALIPVLPLLLFGYSGGPDAGLSGVPGEGACNACHTNNGDPGPAGSGVTITFPNGLTYGPGVKQHLVVTVTDADMSIWGFQVTARQTIGTNPNKMQAGAFFPGTDGFTQVVCGNTTLTSTSLAPCSSLKPLQYIEHTFAGARAGTKGPVTFEFDWVPPSTNVGPVKIYVEAVAGNNDATASGDRIYYTSYTLSKNNQPGFADNNAILNAASFQPGVCTGAWVSLIGANLANSTHILQSSDIAGNTLPTSLDGVSVTVNNKPAFLSYVSPTQINLQAPDDGSLGKVSVAVTNNGAAATSYVDLQPTCPAFFSWGVNTVATRPDFSLVGPANLFPGVTMSPAKPGEVIILWGIGFGPVQPAVPAGQLASTSQISYGVNMPAVFIGGVQADPIYSVLAPGYAGLFQVAVKVPQALADGAQPVVVQLGGYSSPDGFVLAVQH